MTRVSVLILGIVGCGDGIDLRPDANDDAGLPACASANTPPVLPDLCIGGWCWDAPAPAGWTLSSLADGNDLWLLIPGYAVRYRDGVATPFAVSVQLDSHLDGGGAAGVFVVGTQTLSHFDGSQWTPISAPGYVAEFVPVSATRAWAKLNGQLMLWDGASWQPDPLPAELTTFDGLGAVGDDLFIGATVPVGTFGSRYSLWHKSAAGWVVETDLPHPAGMIKAFAPNDVWLGAGSVSHWNGSILSAEGPAAAFFSGGPTDLWTATPDQVSHYDGASWTTCAQTKLSSIASLDGGNVWATRSDGSVAHFDGVAWSGNKPLDDVQALDIFDAQPIALAQRGQNTGVLLRHSADGWTEDSAFPGTSWGYLVGTGANNLWAVSPGALHYDGAAWTDTQPPSNLLSLCPLDSPPALASGFGGFYQFDGAAWISDGGPPATNLYCFPGGEAFADLAQSARHQVAHRHDDVWTWNPEYDEFFAPFAAGGTLWTSHDKDLQRTVAGQWMIAPQAGFSSVVPQPQTSRPQFMSVTGTSATDVYALITYAGPEYIVHHDGTAFTSATAVSDIRAIWALAPDDLILVHANFSLDRMQGTTITTLAPAASTGLIYFPEPIWFASSTVGYAKSDEGYLMKYNGTWSRDTTFPGSVDGLVAFGANDVWAVADGTSVAHYTGSGWTTTALPSLGSGETATAIWGASTNDLWVASGSGGLWRVTNGTPTRFTHSLTSDKPTALWAIAGTATSDVWFVGRHLNTHLSQYVSTLFHWDGNAFSRYNTLRNIQAMRTINGELYACDFDDDVWGPLVFQYTANHWVPRPDLDPVVTFPTLTPTDKPPFYNAIVRQPATKPWWSTGGVAYPPELGGIIWRHD